MWYVYIIKSDKDGTNYVGMCSDLQNRIKRHNSGLVKSTQYRKPWRLHYYEEVESSEIARQREKYLKSGAGREWVERNI